MSALDPVPTGGHPVDKLLNPSLIPILFGDNLGSGHLESPNITNLSTAFPNHPLLDPQLIPRIDVVGVRQNRFIPSIHSTYYYDYF